ncbi:MAG TPA: DNA methylase [Gallionella sp.]|nr:site-specific DNA-methyltransferase [Deltaproteobacteria bacterium]NCP02217.1 site-specific DNA-methyltransferase [Deltaproteobacteria bacterium]HCJ50307.1 DNA methylase [Gallionella sp.]
MKMKENSLFDSLLEEPQKPSGPVTCLGMTFEDDEARRAHFTEELQKKLQDPDFRKIEGFPIGSDEDILNLSDPPYYTACPNPWLADFIAEWEAQKPEQPDGYHYHREPFAADVSEGKNDPIYNAHSYHTKVPHKAIMRYILHYTQPGDIVFDGFCGTGMTGVAGALCGELGSVRTPSVKGASVGERKVLISDLSPIASFISSSLLRPVSSSSYTKEVKRICSEIERDYGHLYATNHNGWKVRDRKALEHKAYFRRGDQKGQVEFTIYSDAIRCPECSHETTYYEVAVDEANDALYSEIRCPACDSVIPEGKWETVFTNTYDPVLRKPINISKIVPVIINYTVGKTRHEKLVDSEDLAAIHEAEKLLETISLPSVQMMPGKETQRNSGIGITHIHHFFTTREHLFVALLIERIKALKDLNIRLLLMFALTSSLPYASRMRRFRADRKGGGPLSGTLYVSSLITPPHVLRTFERNAKTIGDTLSNPVSKSRSQVVSTQSADCLRNMPDNSIDYIFTDPPFGHNFDYSELNFFWEAFLGVFTNQTPEAIVSTSQKKGVEEYRHLMEACFREYYRVLKPGHWITVEFSNTKASVWNAIQSALERCGFVVANVASLDKKQHSFKAVMTPTAVKQDLIITAYKPNGGLEERFEREAATEEGVWDFVRTHLNYLPVIKQHGGMLQMIPERDPRILFDQMVAYYVRKGYPVPISSQEFQVGLSQRFIDRDGMYFLSEQVAEYDRKKMTSQQLVQASLFVSDEASAIQWLRQVIKEKPQTFQDVHPLFIKETQRAWNKNESSLELSTLLEQNFLRYDGKGPVPEQIHAYLSTNWKELRNLPKDDPTLVTKARDRWYVPDPNKAGDLEKLREKALLKEFEEYKEVKKKLKVFRLEAVRAGFKKAWQERDYAVIVAVADKIPNNVLEEDPKLLMWYDQAVTRMGGE